jgi:uncharacterized spore protein YtfJ
LPNNHSNKGDSLSTEATSPAAAEQSQRRADELLATLADRIGARFSAATVYGTPIERDGVTVVPIAAARFGIGAGGGSDPSKGQTGRAAEEEAVSHPPATSS